MDGRAAARLVGSVGLWSNLDRLSAAELREYGRTIERSSRLRALWYPETVGGKEAFSLATFLLASSERLVVATGIASVWARDATAMENGARAIGEWFPRRFILGIGISHRTSAATRGHEYSKPYARMRDYLDQMDAVTYSGPVAHEPVPRVLAALGPQMLRLAAERGAGAHPYFVPVEHTSAARKVLGAEPLLAVEQAAVLEPSAEKARAIARGHTRRYLVLENYVNNLRRLGWSDMDLAPDGGSDALVDAIVAHGDAASVAKRVEDHLARGADHVCIQILVADGGRAPLAELRALEPRLPG